MFLATAPYSWDWHRIWIGDQSPVFLLEILFRTSVLFVYLLIMIRLMGQRGIGDVSFFEIALIIAIGSAAGDPMFYPDVPLLHGMAAITVVVALHQFVLKASQRSQKIQRLTEGEPQPIVTDGLLDLNGIEQAQLARNEVMFELRQRGVEHLGQVRRAYFEVDGQVSVFFYDSENVRPGLPILPPEPMQTKGPQAGDRIDESGAYACANCGYVLQLEQNEHFRVCPRCKEIEWARADSKPHQSLRAS